MAIVVELGDLEEAAYSAAKSAGVDLPTFLRDTLSAKLQLNNFAKARAWET